MTREIARQAFLFGRASGEEIHLDEIGDFDKRPRFRHVDEIIQCKTVAGVLQPPASFEGFSVGLQILEYFADDEVARQQRQVLAHEKFARTIDEREPPLRQPVEAEEKQIINGRRRPKRGVALMEKVLRAVAAKQFVSEDSFVRSEDRLAR
ncbi:MAG: hypothetical protein WA002_04340 [Candidatus Acidiferrales bacterium]